MEERTGVYQCGDKAEREACAHRAGSKPEGKRGAAMYTWGEFNRMGSSLRNGANSIVFPSVECSRLLSTLGSRNESLYYYLRTKRESGGEVAAQRAAFLLLDCILVFWGLLVPVETARRYGEGSSLAALHAPAPSKFSAISFLLPLLSFSPHNKYIYTASTTPSALISRICSSASSNTCTSLRTHPPRK